MLQVAWQIDKEFAWVFIRLTFEPFILVMLSLGLLNLAIPTK